MMHFIHKRVIKYLIGKDQMFIGELSKLTKTSIRTIRYYDSIHLLTPSSRLNNSYRIYSETDLLKLQKIIILKSICGFQLSKIRTLLKEEVDIVKLFLEQADKLYKKADSLFVGSKTINTAISNSSKENSASLDKIIELIKIELTNVVNNNKLNSKKKLSNIDA